MTQPLETKQVVDHILFGEDVIDTVASRPHIDLENNVDNILDYLDRHPVSHFDVSDTLTTGTTFAYGGGTFAKGVTTVDILAGTLSLVSGDNTYYIEIDISTNTVTQNTVGFTDGNIPLNEVVVSGGAITTVTDKRTFLNNHHFGTLTHTGDFIITGNLTVQGTQTILNTATLDVEDVNISMNVGGNQASANGFAGITVSMTDATNTTLIYDSSLASRFKCGDLGSESEIITAGTVQILTGDKTFTGSVLIANANAYLYVRDSDTGYASSAYRAGIIFQDDVGIPSGYLGRVSANTDFEVINNLTNADINLITQGSGVVKANGAQLITTANIGSQSVSYATSAGDAATLQTHAASYFATSTHNHSGVYLPLSGGTLTSALTIASPSNQATLSLHDTTNAKSSSFYYAGVALLDSASSLAAWIGRGYYAGTALNIVNLTTNSDINLTTLGTGSVLVNGVQIGTAFGTRTSYSTGVAYLASRDILVYGTTYSPDNTVVTLIGYSGVGSPTTERVRQGSREGSYGSICMAVQAGEYWQVNASGTTSNLYYI